MKRVLLLLATCCWLAASQTSFMIGVGIWDVTGTPAQAGMMGYAMPQQKANGIHIRQRARAFIFADATNDTNRVVFVSSDICMVYQEVREHVVQNLTAQYGGLYTLDNVMLSGTHTHSGPAGFAYYLLYDITSLGFIKENFDAIVSGIVSAIMQAHDNLAPGNVLWAHTVYPQPNKTSSNRSPAAYLLNKDALNSTYTDLNMTLLRLQDEDETDIGMVNWFAVHGTSMNNTNGLISGDNKGYSSYLFERQMNPGGLPGMGPYVAAFAQGNEGDSSPNTKGAKCPNGSACDWVHSTCDGKTEFCIAAGPGNNMFESCQIIGETIFDFAQKLFENATQPLSGSKIQYIHQWVQMDNITVGPPFVNKTVTTCEAALGDSFAGGTTDGPGAFDFVQGSNSTKDNPFWNFIGSFLAAPSAAQMACHAPKPILLNVGDANFPAPWVPTILPLQIFRIDNVFILGMPGTGASFSTAMSCERELTTQSGRRLKGAMETVLANTSISNPIVVIAGLSNSYSHYIATPEEYQMQRYEAASTLYGPNTLPAYLQEFTRLLKALLNGENVGPGPSPPNLTKTFTFFPPVFFDHVPSGHKFGDVVSDVNSTYAPNTTASVTFYGANPRNNLHTQDSYLFVERQNGTKGWVTVAVDGDWETKFIWKDAGDFVSLITVQWDIPATITQKGTYRIRYTGDAKSLTGTITPFTGISGTFNVTLA